VTGQQLQYNYVCRIGTNAPKNDLNETYVTEVGCSNWYAHKKVLDRGFRMTQTATPKGERMPTSAATPAHSHTAAARLQQLREKNACSVHKDIGHPDEIREDGLAVFDALAEVRSRANASIDKNGE
jgi:hypothetical protein